MIAVSDTGPLLYLSLIDRVGLLPQIFARVVIPLGVAVELSDPSTPPQAFALIEHPPTWLQICEVPSIDSSLASFGPGEQQAITLAVSTAADLLLIDDRVAKVFAIQVVGLAASGTIGVLYEAAIRDHIVFTAAEFDESVQTLLATNFRSSKTLIAEIRELSHKLHERKLRSTSR